jgi:penicillin V acylase-like amidase (Ntn superfamily)
MPGCGQIPSASVALECRAEFADRKVMGRSIARTCAVPCAVLALALPRPSSACSRIFWNDNGQANVVARTVDLYRSDEAQIVVFPRGMKRDGIPGRSDGYSWKSRYASIAVTAFGSATSDGMNEKGLSANLLYLDQTTYETRDGRPALSNLLWAQWVLDGFATVDEALAAMSDVQVVSTIAAEREWPLHLSIADASGDSAIIEFVAGKPVVHHGKQYTVMTNEPTLSEQLANLKHYKLFGGSRSMPGDIDPMSRFVRASSYLKTLPEPKGVREAVAGVYSVARTVAVPFGAEDTSSSVTTDTWPTLWFGIADLTHGVYYFQSTKSPNLYWVDFAKLSLDEGTPARGVDAYDPSLDGDVSGRLRPLGAS